MPNAVRFGAAMSDCLDQNEAATVTVVVERDVATIDIEFNPKVGDTLTGPNGSFKLDALFSDNGYSRRFILIKTA